MVVDRKGRELRPGDRVRVFHRLIGPGGKATVIQIFPLLVTGKYRCKGHWVSVDVDGFGPLGLGSYLLEKEETD